MELKIEGISNDHFISKRACKLESTSLHVHTLGGGLERTRAGWLGGEGDGGRAITEE